MQFSPVMASGPRIENILTCDVISIGFAKEKDGSWVLTGPTSLVANVETFFGLDLLDELAFFTPSGKAGELFEIPVSAQATKAGRIFLTCVGDKTTPDLRLAGAAIGRKVREKSIDVVSLCAKDKLEIKAHAISMVLGAYTWNQKSDAKKGKPKFFVVTNDSRNIEEAQIIAHAVCMARNLIHTPANIKNPAWMASQAQKIAREKKLTINVLAGKGLDKFGGLRAVGNSSPNPGPRFIQIGYVPKGVKKNRKHIVLVGKGITFDTGGISLKRPYDTMTAMKSDMAGAAAILSVLSALADLKPDVQVSALLMCAENALSGTSQRPSDVITHFGGTTVEVINTDAEGRLVLADGLAFADLTLNPDFLVDIATLTGAATLALGRQYGAMYTRDKALARSLVAVGERSGDRLWHMPLIDDYEDALESDIADFNHTADKGDYSAGSVTAALFLEKFVGDRRWVHLDIAGAARSESDAGESPKGGTGFGVRLLIDWITNL
ncbi:unannotated protein [freshwater metagenome]|uniref:Unannotated protein n=1 Tax=freshwater metagenome TaxID=449393 RepID=A0A6J7XQB6_9ZZZZ|nr:leucyl aminopeptidase family protein [Actinomycetota bacterium]